jgi:hypothetical protein
VVDVQIDEESSINIFVMFVETNEPTKGVVNKELKMFRRFQMDVKGIDCPFKMVGET